MSKSIQKEQQEILAVIDAHPEGLHRGQISELLNISIKDKTLQRRLATLIADGQVIIEGVKRGAKYFPAGRPPQPSGTDLKDNDSAIFSQISKNTLNFLNKPVYARENVSYKRSFLEDYVPNETMYVPIDLRQRLQEEGKRIDDDLAAGTYARQISERLLIDLSYNSSRLEGNTYSRLDTQRLVEEGISAEGKVNEETVMIVNHKEAILFLIENAADIELNSFTLLNLHNLLSQDLLSDPASCGNIRRTEVAIGKSAYTPLSNPHVIKEMLELILLKARKIEDPFEQGFFLLIQLSYLQAFEDVNKRTARLACNIPFIKSNLCPLSFTDVSRDDYSAALLAVYEKNEVGPMQELFCWAYSRSAQQYEVVKSSLGEIDAFRIQYRAQRKAVMGQVVKRNLHGKYAEQFIERYCTDNNIESSEKFTAMTLADLSALHAGGIVGLGITETEFNDWLDTESQNTA
jgi:Fic family protein